jgi:hypothetical protein
MNAQLFVIELSDEAGRPSKRRAGAITYVREISSPSSAISHSRGAIVPLQPFLWSQVCLARTVNRSTVQLGEMQWFKILQ